MNKVYKASIYVLICSFASYAMEKDIAQLSSCIRAQNTKELAKILDTTKFSEDTISEMETLLINTYQHQCSSFRKDMEAIANIFVDYKKRNESNHKENPNDTIILWETIIRNDFINNVLIMKLTDTFKNMQLMLNAHKKGKLCTLENMQQIDKEQDDLVQGVSRGDFTKVGIVEEEIQKKLTTKLNQILQAIPKLETYMLSSEYEGV